MGFNKVLAMMNNRRNVCGQSEHSSSGEVRTAGRVPSRTRTRMGVEGSSNPVSLTLLHCSISMKSVRVKKLSGRTQRSSQPRQAMAEVVGDWGGGGEEGGAAHALPHHYQIIPQSRCPKTLL